MKKSLWLFSLTLIMSVMITLSSNNWISMWMGLELNMMSFIPIILSKVNKSSSEAAMIYFLTQSVSSILMLAMVMMSMTKHETTKISNIIITMTLLIKMGAAPFHKWMPDMMAKMSWNKCLLLMTWQKIAPLMMISNMNMSHFIINMSIIWSVGIGSIGGINQSSLRKMMAYSSINHMGWLLAINKSMNLWMMYMTMYSLLTWMVCKMFNSYKMYFINQIMSMNMKKSEKMMMFIMMLSMGGLPPFIGFMPKWMTIQTMMNSKEIILLMVMIMFSLITLMYYIRIMTNLMLNFNSPIKWMTYKNNKNIMIMTTINLLLPLIMMIDML
uniref:NADH dehydrogenase subunit 2 n=1 Tax=Mecidea indica TaxID=3127717 RepID=UPI0030E115FC